MFILGDLFDYWFEYKQAVPKGFVRVLSVLAKFTEAGIPVHIFTGNHDMWLSNYLIEEIGLQVYKNPIQRELHGQSFFLGHGDGLGPGDYGYKFIKKIFSNKINQWFFARLHPNFGLGLMKYFSRKSRESEAESPPFLGADKEWLVQYCERKIQTENHDYFIFGHRHLPIDYTLSNGHSRYINCGDWLSQNTYVKYSNNQLTLESFTE